MVGRRWTGALILIPEHPFRYERVFHLLSARLGESDLSRGLSQRPRYSVIVVAEGARAEDGEMVTIDDRHDAFGHVRLGGIGEVLAKRIAARRLTKRVRWCWAIRNVVGRRVLSIESWE